MARRQTRRGVSLNRDVYDALMKACSRAEISASQMVVDALRNYGIDVPTTTHQPEIVVQRAIIMKIAKRNRRLNGWVDR